MPQLCCGFVSGLRLDDPVVEGEDDGGGPVPQVQLGEDVADVALLTVTSEIESSPAISALDRPRPIMVRTSRSRSVRAVRRAVWPLRAGAAWGVAGILVAVRRFGWSPRDV
jgi:hypothetical protein